MVFGIIGYGRFGKLWAKALAPFGTILIFDKRTSLAPVKTVDVLFLTVPISELQQCCQKVKPFLTLSTWVVDCCSVKTYPIRIMRRVFGKKQPLLATHPLFGPDSVKKNGGLARLKMVICPLEKPPKKLLTLFRKMGLTLITTTATQHDKAMARSQALVHFIGRGLFTLQMKPQAMATPDFQTLLNMNEMVNNDPWQLFLDMQRFNPYAAPIRKRFIRKLVQIEKLINA